jgi:hypothetical protein
MEAPADACPRCGETGQLGSACKACGESLLVDLILQGTVGDERLRYRAARALAECGPPAPSLLEAKKAFEVAGARLLTNVSRSFALRAASALAACGVSASPRPARPRKRPTLALAAAALAAVAAAALALAVLRPWPERAPEGPPVRASGLAEHRGAVKPDDPAAVNLSTEELGRRAQKSVATVVCASRIGAGFFIEPEKLVTNAHVACPEGEIAHVRLQDGRELLGKTVARDDWIDTAVLDVAGAAAQPLTVGDATALKPGEPIALVGRPPLGISQRRDGARCSPRSASRIFGRWRSSAPPGIRSWRPSGHRPGGWRRWSSSAGRRRPCPRLCSWSCGRARPASAICPCMSDPGFR